MNSDKNLTAIFGNLLCDVKDLGDWGIAGGHIDAAKLRLTVDARRIEAKKLIDAGVSQRKAAKALGVSHSQIRRDTGRDTGTKGAKSGTKGPTLDAAGRGPDDPAYGDDNEPPVHRAIVRQSLQRAYYVNALDLMDKMSRKTRAKFFAYLKEHFNDNASKKIA